MGVCVWFNNKLFTNKILFIQKINQKLSTYIQTECTVHNTTQQKLLRYTIYLQATDIN